jgi:hypothetical protein
LTDSLTGVSVAHEYTRTPRVCALALADFLRLLQNEESLAFFRNLASRIGSRYVVVVAVTRITPSRHARIDIDGAGGIERIAHLLGNSLILISTDSKALPRRTAS